MSSTGERIELTSIGNAGPIWVWPDKIAAVWARVPGPNVVASTAGDPPPTVTLIAVDGSRDLIAVMESVEDVLDAIDAAAAGVAQANSELLA